MVSALIFSFLIGMVAGVICVCIGMNAMHLVITTKNSMDRLLKQAGFSSDKIKEVKI